MGRRPKPDPEYTEREEREKLDSEKTDFEFYFTESLKDEDFELKVYRLEKSGTRKNKTFLERLENEFPKEEDLAMRYGSGWYQIIGIHPTKKILLEREVRIDPIWDTRRYEAEAGTGGAVPSPPGGGMADFMTMFRAVSEMLKPILTGAQTKQESPSALLETAMDLGMQNMKRMNAYYLKMQGELHDQRSALMSPDNNEREIDDMSPIAKEVINAIKFFGGKLFGANGSTDQLMESIKADPRIQELMENSAAVEEIYSEAAADPNIGREKIEGLFNKLNIEIPQNETA